MYWAPTKQDSLFPWTAYSPNGPKRQQTGEVQNTVHPASSSQPLRIAVFSAEGEQCLTHAQKCYFPTHLTTLFCTEGLWKSMSTELLTLNPSSLQSESCIRAILFIFYGVGQWITLLHLFSSWHFPIVSHFPGAIEALKRQLVFRWQNIEKVRAVRHNAAIHGAHQLLKCHSFFLMTKATEHNRKQTSIITCFQELTGFDFLHKSWDRKDQIFKCGFLSFQHSPLPAVLYKPAASCHLHHRLICFPALPSFCRQEYLLTPASTDHAQQ